MKILKFIPTKNRAEEFDKFTGTWLPLDKDTRIFLEPQDVIKYKNVPVDNIVVLPEDNKGLGYVLDQANQYAIENNYDVIWKLDDDIAKFRKRKQFTPDTPEAKALQAQENFKEVEKLALQILEKKPQIGAIGFPYEQEMFQAKNYDIDKKLQTSYIIRTNLYNPRPDITAQEDYWAYINVRMKNYHTLRLSNYGIRLGIPVGGGTGGIQDLGDRKAMAFKEMKIIQGFYPNVKFKAKPETPWGYEVDFSKTKLGGK